MIHASLIPDFVLGPILLLATAAALGCYAACRLGLRQSDPLSEMMLPNHTTYEHACEALERAERARVMDYYSRLYDLDEGGLSTDKSREDVIKSLVDECMSGALPMPPVWKPCAPQCIAECDGVCARRTERDAIIDRIIKHGCPLCGSPGVCDCRSGLI